MFWWLAVGGIEKLEVGIRVWQGKNTHIDRCSRLEKGLWTSFNECLDIRKPGLSC